MDYWGQPCWLIAKTRGLRIEHWGPRGGSSAVHDDNDKAGMVTQVNRACLSGGCSLKTNQGAYQHQTREHSLSHGKFLGGIEWELPYWILAEKVKF